MPTDLEAIARAGRLADAGHWEQSAAIYRKLLASGADYAGIRHNLATVLLPLGRWDEAIEQCRCAIRQQPANSRALNTLGVALSRAGRPAEAIEALRAALAVEPGYAKAAFNLGQALDQAGERDGALAAYRQALSLDPTLEAAAFELAVLGQLPSPPQMPPAYVLDLFDNYAPRFDQHLAELNYLVPAMLRDAVRGIRASGCNHAVDLGCGTGLVGAALRPHVQRLTGIDLSPAMIAASRQRGVYDGLIQAEVVHWLSSTNTPAADAQHAAIKTSSAAGPTPTRSSQASLDLILAGDLLIYLGDLQPLFAAVARCLSPLGLFAFSVELASGQDYVLQATRRYAHSIEYLRRLGAANRLAEIACLAGSLRRQEGREVPGLVFVFGSTPVG